MIQGYPLKNMKAESPVWGSAFSYCAGMKSLNAIRGTLELISAHKKRETRKGLPFFKANVKRRSLWAFANQFYGWKVGSSTLRVAV